MAPSTTPVRLRRAGEKPEPFKVNLTNRAIEKLQPAKERYRVYDQTIGGLYVQVTPGGAKSLYLGKRMSGRYRKIKLGDHPALTVDAARKLVTKMAGQIADGVDVAEQRQRKRAAAANVQTIKGAWEHYRDYHLKPNRSPATIQNDGYIYAALPWKTHRLDAVTTADIKRLHEKLAKRGEVWANRVVQFLRRLYNYAAEELDYNGVNPVKLRLGRARRAGRGGKSVELAPEQSRDRFIEPNEAPKFFKALEDEPDNDFADLIRLLIYTAARRGNVQAMRWEHVSFDRAVWDIPADEAKAGEAIRVPLSTYAISVLKDRKENAKKKAVFVFPASRGKTGHIMEPKKQWWELRERAGMPDLKMHDLRRSVATWATTLGVPYPVVMAMLGHKPAGVTAIYARPDIEAVRDAFERTTAALLEAKGAENA